MSESISILFYSIVVILFSGKVYAVYFFGEIVIFIVLSHLLMVALDRQHGSNFHQSAVPNCNYFSHLL